MKVAVLLALVCAASAFVADDHFAKAHPCLQRQNCMQSDLRMVDVAGADEQHTVVFAVKRRNEELLDAFLKVAADPESPRFRQWMSHEELTRLREHPEATRAVEHYLRLHGLEYKTDAGGGYISARGTVAQLNRLLKTTFYKFRSAKLNETYLRAYYTNLPAAIAQFTDFVAGTVDLPPTLKPKPDIQQFREASADEAQAVASGKTDIKLLRSYYKITDVKVASTKSTQSVFESLGQSYSPADLHRFEERFGIPHQHIAKVIGPNKASSCAFDPNNCAEASLDVQYIIGVAPSAPTTFWSIGGFGSIFLEWVRQVTAAADPPKVHSISYGSIEQEENKAQLLRFDSDLKALAAKGLTVHVASGDDGVANFRARNNPSACGFHPSFPSTSAHILSVGATQGPEFGKPEVACSSKTGGLITTGGGFSTVFSRPAYQDKAVRAYLANPNVNLPPLTDFASTGRGYPDIAMIGHNYVVAIAGRFFIVSGTSASTPVAAAVATLVNGHRLAAGKSTLGFMNMAIYKNGDDMAGSWFNDITVGENNCAAGQNPFQTCCPRGFTAAKGWDPLTGWGSYKYDAFSAANR